MPCPSHSPWLFTSQSLIWSSCHSCNTSFSVCGSIKLLVSMQSWSHVSKCRCVKASSLICSWLLLALRTLTLITSVRVSSECFLDLKITERTVWNSCIGCPKNFTFSVLLKKNMDSSSWFSRYDEIILVSCDAQSWERSLSCIRLITVRNYILLFADFVYYVIVSFFSKAASVFNYE
jgi:hypothetical protein